MLNNRPYFFQGVLDQGYWPESLYTPPADAAMIFDISKMKEQGFNMIRKHVKIEPLRWYYHCDRLGMMVWQDMVNGGGKINMPLVSYLPTAIPAFGSWLKDHHYRLLGRADEKCRKIWEADALETVVHLYNCPCISMWTLFNEGWGQFDAVRIAKRISTLDGTRQINHASGWFDQGGGDVRSIHNYFRPLHMIRDKRPVVLGEYGGYSCQIPGHVRSSEVYGYRSFRSEQAWSRARKKLQKTVSHLEEKGLSGAVYTQLSDVENEINGLYTYDRRHCKGKTDESSICNGEGA
jgi:beta-galactosidase/beta-glucuronidase